MLFRSDGEGSINQALCDTIASLFPFVSIVDVPGTTNRELFAGMEEDPAAALAAGLLQVEDPTLRSLLEKVGERLTVWEGGSHILTDDQAPVVLLGMRAIDGLIQSELEYCKRIYREEGISGLLQAF